MASAPANHARILKFAVLGIAAIGLSSVFDPNPWLVWNVTASAPIGLYAVAGAPGRGDFALVRTPDSVRDLADTRRYLPRKADLLKRIAGLPGDQICAHDTHIFINGRMVSERLQADTAGRSMPSWSGCQMLADEVFLLTAEVPTSFDSRYFGPVPTASVIGKAIPLWIP